MSAPVIGGSLLLLAALLLVGVGLRFHLRPAQRLFIPASVLAGAVGLALGPEILGRLMQAIAGADAVGAQGVLPDRALEVWRELPELLISVVFASMFLGRSLPPLRRAVELGGPQVALSFVLSAGQIALGLVLALLVLGPVFGLPAVAGTLIEIGFVGGHGAAAGLEPAFESAGFSAGTDLGLGLATLGIVTGIVSGIVLVRWAVRTGRVAAGVGGGSAAEVAAAGVRPKDDRPPAAVLSVAPSAVEPLTLHLGLIAAAVLTGQILLSGLQAIERALWIDSVALLETMPLFPLAMVGGLLVQLVINRVDRRGVVDRLSVRRLQGMALDLLIVSALATLSLGVLASNIGPFLLLAAVGLVWNIGVFLLLAPRIIPSHWFERGIGDLGQAFGVSATGLLLLRVADPDDQTPASDAFGYKQLGFEPFFGGGLVTAMAVPLVAQVGPWPLLITMTLLAAGSALFGVLYFGRRRAEAEP